MITTNVKVLKGETTKFFFTTENGQEVELSVFTYEKRNKVCRTFHEITLYVEGVNIANNVVYNSKLVGSDNYNTPLSFSIDFSRIFIDNKAALDLPLEVQAYLIEAYIGM